VFSIENISLLCDYAGKVGVAGTKAAVADCKSNSKE